MKKRKRGKVIGNRPGLSLLGRQIRAAETDEEALVILKHSPYLQPEEKEQIVKQTDAELRRIEANG